MNLQKEVDIMYNNDQLFRQKLRDIDNGTMLNISRQKVISEMHKIDSINHQKLIEIYDEYGFLGYDEVNKKTSRKFWLLVQHQDRYVNFQSKILNEMKLDIKNNNASKIDYAYLIDRVRINQGLNQVYGTQMQLNDSKNSFEPKPVDEPDKLNIRRQEMKLSPIEDYIDLMNKDYFGYLKTK